MTFLTSQLFNSNSLSLSLIIIFIVVQEAVAVLLCSELDDSSVCSRVPFSVEINAVFIVDLNKLSSPNDVTCDDMGVWVWGGSKRRWVSVEENGFTTFLKTPTIQEAIGLTTSCGRGTTPISQVQMSRR